MNAFLIISAVAVSILASFVIYTRKSNRKFIDKVNKKDDD